MYKIFFGSSHLSAHPSLAAEGATPSAAIAALLSKASPEYSGIPTVERAELYCAITFPAEGGFESLTYHLTGPHEG